MTFTGTREHEKILTVADLGGSGGEILVLHRTDRWYVGDFLRHAGWLGWLQRNLPTARIDLATHSAYLPVYGDDRFGRMLDVTTLGPADLGRYDLVIEPTSFPAPEAPAPGIRGLLRTWDRGWALHAHGRQVASGVKDEVNYFRAAHPRSLGLPDSTPPGTPVSGTALIFSDAERDAARVLLQTMAPGEGPVVVYNPTASNLFTRQTGVAKEVDNTLTVAEHIALLRQITGEITGHDVVVAAPVKPGDARNIAVVGEVAAAIAGRPVMTGLREFAALLADPRVCSTLGGGTGSNTHLAALVGTWALSIERHADTAMRANWSQPEVFQMGSFRWRNPSPVTGVHTMAWNEPDQQATDDRVAGAGGAFAAHHCLAHGTQADLFDRHQIPAVGRHSWRGAASVDLQLGQVLTAWMTSFAREHFTDFADEIAYLRHCFPHLRASSPRADLAELLADAEAAAATDPGAHSLAAQLFRDSNLHKLVTLMTDPALRRPVADAGERVTS